MKIFCLKFLQILIFVSIEDHMMLTKEKFFNYISAKYLQHFHLIEINNLYMMTSMQGSCKSLWQYTVDTSKNFSHFFWFILDTIKVKWTDSKKPTSCKKIAHHFILHLRSTWKYIFKKIHFFIIFWLCTYLKTNN